MAIRAYRTTVTNARNTTSRGSDSRGGAKDELCNATKTVFYAKLDAATVSQTLILCRRTHHSHQSCLIHAQPTLRPQPRNLHALLTRRMATLRHQPHMPQHQRRLISFDLHTSILRTIPQSPSLIHNLPPYTHKLLRTKTTRNRHSEIQTPRPRPRDTQHSHPRGGEKRYDASRHDTRRRLHASPRFLHRCL